MEQLFRSLGLVLLDNGSAEFTFIVRFFARAALGNGASTPKPPNVLSPGSTPLDSPVLGPVSDAGKSRGGRRRGGAAAASAESLKDAERIWNEVFGSALEYTTQFFQSIIATPPSSVSLLTIIRLNDELIKTAESRGALPLIPYLTGWKLALWPVYRKAMDAHIDSIKALADTAEGKGLTSWVSKAVKDSAVRHVALRYGVLFSCVVALADQAEDAMLFSRWVVGTGESTNPQHAPDAQRAHPAHQDPGRQDQGGAVAPVVPVFDL